MFLLKLSKKMFYRSSVYLSEGSFCFVFEMGCCHIHRFKWTFFNIAFLLVGCLFVHFCLCIYAKFNADSIYVFLIGLWRAQVLLRVTNSSLNFQYLACNSCLSNPLNYKMQKVRWTRITWIRYLKTWTSNLSWNTSTLS